MVSTAVMATTARNSLLMDHTKQGPDQYPDKAQLKQFAVGRENLRIGIGTGHLGGPEHTLQPDEADGGPSQGMEYGVIPEVVGLLEPTFQHHDDPADQERHRRRSKDQPEHHNGHPPALGQQIPAIDPAAYHLWRFIHGFILLYNG